MATAQAESADGPYVGVSVGPELSVSLTRGFPLGVGVEARASLCALASFGPCLGAFGALRLPHLQTLDLSFGGTVSLVAGKAEGHLLRGIVGAGADLGWTVRTGRASGFYLGGFGELPPARLSFGGWRGASPFLPDCVERVSWRDARACDAAVGVELLVDPLRSAGR